MKPIKTLFIIFSLLLLLAQQSSAFWGCERKSDADKFIEAAKERLAQAEAKVQIEAPFGLSWDMTKKDLLKLGATDLTHLNLDFDLEDQDLPNPSRIFPNFSIKIDSLEKLNWLAGVKSKRYDYSSGGDKAAFFKPLFDNYYQILNILKEKYGSGITSEKLPEDESIWYCFRFEDCELSYFIRKDGVKIYLALKADSLMTLYLEIIYARGDQWAKNPEQEFNKNAF